MVDFGFLIAFIGLPIAAWLLSRSLLFVSVWLGLGLGLAGNAVQGLIALGIDWNTRSLQLLALVVMAAVVVMAARRRRRAVVSDFALGHQFMTILLPALAIAAFLVAMRILAPGDPGALTAVGYFINHPQAEDNAKWLHLTAQLADGRGISFSGYAGGPLLLLMAIMATLISVLSIILLGGVNEVAVAANTVIGTQFLLIALVPFALAVFAERRPSFALRGQTQARGTLAMPPVLVWVGILVGASASAVVTSYGHLSFQFVLLVLAAWLAISLSDCSRSLRLASTLTVITSATVWLPLTPVAVILVAVLVVWSVRRRWWSGLLLTLVTLLVSADALISSSLYLVGIDFTSIPVIGTVLAPLSPVGADESIASGNVGDVIASAHLLRAPGATEITGPLLGLIVAAAFLLGVRFLQGSRDLSLKVGPVALLAGYALTIALIDAVTTATSPNYSLNKLLFAFVVSVGMAYIPVALFAIDAAKGGMTALRWAASGTILVLLVIDSIVPRALSALSPLLWPTTNAVNPQYWAPAEVNGTGNQPLASSPVACLFAPPAALAPTSLPLGQESYACSRLLIGLTGLEDSLRGLPILLQTDWLSRESNWDELSYLLAEDAQRVPGRAVVLMTPDGGVAGIAPLQQFVSGR